MTTLSYMLYTHIRNTIRLFAIRLRHVYLTKVMGMDIAPSALVSWGVTLDKTFPQGIHIGEESYIASGTRILTHDYCTNRHEATHIGRRCFIGTDALILCGTTIGDHAVVGAGAVVTKDVPPNTIVAGNPARVIRQGITTNKFGQLTDATQTQKI